MRFVLLIAAAVVAVIAGYAAMQMSGNPAPEPVPVAQETSVAPVNEVMVLISKADIDLGEVVTQDMIDVQPMPKHLVPPGFIVSGTPAADKLVGSVVRSSFKKDEPFILSKLTGFNERGFLAAALPAGKRAVTIPVDAISGVAGYVFPGDRVDIVLTQNVPGDVKVSGIRSSGKPVVTEIVAANAMVLAVNTRDVSGAVNATPTSVTLQVNQEDVQKLRQAEKFGALSLALRSLKDKDGSDIEVATPNDVIIRIIRGVGRGNDSVVIVPDVGPHARPTTSEETSSEKEATVSDNQATYVEDNR
ncbi:MAG: Flp pilus assembly protein CpaB [Rickettsiales bacterium]|nr:Flp pilus assembly protein CpaB [Rickettsiales bacterium]